MPESKPLTVGSIVLAIFLGNLLTGAVSAALYLAAKWLLWQ
jgi:hypothetical protein